MQVEVTKSPRNKKFRKSSPLAPYKQGPNQTRPPPPPGRGPMSGSHLSKDFFDLMCSSHRLGPSACRRICAPFTALPHAARCSLRARALSALLCLIVSSRWPMRRHASMSCCPRAALSLSLSQPLSLSSSLPAPLSAPPSLLLSLLLSPALS